MLTKREFVKQAAAVVTAAIAVPAVSQAPFDVVVYNDWHPQAQAFAANLSERGVRALAVQHVSDFRPESGRAGAEPVPVSILTYQLVYSRNLQFRISRNRELLFQALIDRSRTLLNLQRVRFWRDFSTSCTAWMPASLAKTNVEQVRMRRVLSASFDPLSRPQLGGGQPGGSEMLRRAGQVSPSERQGECASGSTNTEAADRASVRVIGSIPSLR